MDTIKDAIDAFKKFLEEQDWRKVVQSINEAVRTDEFAVHVRLDATLGGGLLKF